ncbi:MAG: acyl-CoA dehydrogenase family protein [Candidatus Lokiarchaeota archaeon]|nr:acyl-CoA dehydrogenase family protein [Candidatus Lokiarchaeota archaeon]
MAASKDIKHGISRVSIGIRANRGIDFTYSPSLNFEYNEQLKLLKKSVRNFAESVLGPIAKIADEKARFSWETAAELSKINAWGIQIPEKYGGAELDTISYAITIEEISRICASTALNVSAHNSLGAYPIFKWGTEEQKKRYLPDISCGKKICAFALTEPNAGSDAGGINSLAVQDGEGFILNGSKIFITNGGIASTLLAISKCKMENGDKGLAAFILESDMDGYEVGKKEDKMGMRGSDTSSIYFNNIRVPKENMLGAPSDGFKIALNALDYGRVGIAAQSLGIAQAAYEHSVNYANSRIQFGKSISNFQAISFKLAEMSTKIETTRLIIQKTAFMRDKGINFSKEAAMSKYIASKVAREVVEESIQIHGGYGYMKDLPLERYYRDAKACEIYEGTSEIMKSIISQHILRGNL